MDIFFLSIGQIAGHLPLLAGLLALAALLATSERLLRDRLGPWARRSIQGGALVLASGVGLWLAFQTLWLCDDAYISFRYARNFAEGNGLVFNVGEWVEGYTNFLWTLLLGLLGKVGVDIPYAGLFGNLACFVLALFFTAAAVRRASPTRILIPFAALALAGMRPFTTFASSGLETMPAAMLVAAGLWASSLRRGAFWAGLAFTTAALTRPDHVLIYGCMGLAIVGEDLLHRRELPLPKRLDFRRYVAYAAPFVLLYVPYFLWRWQAYGDLFPNTYYAKSGGDTYYRQGFVYLGHFFWTTGAWAWIPVLAVSLFGRARERNETRLRLFALLALPLFGHYVVKVGGDFMEHRFFVTLLPIAAVAMEVGLRWRLAEVQSRAKAITWGALGVVAFGAALLPVRIIKPWEKRWYLADEPSFYRVGKLFPLQIESGYMARGLKLHEVFTARGIKPRIAGDSIGLVGYYSDLPIVDALGLVNRNIAHKPITRRGRPGHEKFASLDEILAEGAVLDTGNPWGERWAGANAAVVDGFAFHFLRWDPELVMQLRKLPGARLPDPAADIARIAGSGSRREVLESLGFYRAFLGNGTGAKELVGQLEERLGAVADFEGALPEGAKLTGDFRVTLGDLPRGASGTGWLSSLYDSAAKTGSVEIPLGTLERNELRFALGGSASVAVKVELVADGSVVRSASPSGTPGLSPVAWPVAELRGRSAVLRVVDADPAPGAGILVDAIHWDAPSGDVRERLRTAGEGQLASVLREAEEVIPATDPDLQVAIARFPTRWTLDRLPEGATVEGQAFGAGPVGGALAGQAWISGIQGTGFLNSYHGGDRFRGRVVLPEMLLSGAPIELLVGGGRECRRTYVGLEVEGKVVARSCGRNDEVLRPAVIQTGRWAGKRGRLVIVDDSETAWGHILADDVLVGAAPLATVQPQPQPSRTGGGSLGGRLRAIQAR